jgi:hypothetical protein
MTKPVMAMKPKQKFANVWDALEDTPTAAAKMTMRSDLLIALRRQSANWPSRSRRQP